MTSNQSIAITWAIQQTQNGQCVLSDQFFAPFNKVQSQQICRELAKHNILVLATSPTASKSAFLASASICGKVSDSIKDGICIQRNGSLILTKLHKFCV